MTTDKITSTITYQGKSVDLENKAAVEELLTPMFHEIQQKRGTPMKPRQQFLLPELEPTAIHLAQLVGQLAALEEEKKTVNQDLKERMDLLKVQIKHAATAITDSLEGPDGVTRIKMVPEDRQPGVPQ
jgi:hypothetical protein